MLPAFFNSSNAGGHWLVSSMCWLLLQEVDLSYYLLAACNGKFMSSNMVIAELLCQMLRQLLLGEKALSRHLLSEAVDHIWLV